MKGRAKQRKMAATFELLPGKRYARRMGLHLPLPLRIARFGATPEELGSGSAGGDPQELDKLSNDRLE